MPPERVNLADIHRWVLIEATQAEMDAFDSRNRYQYLLSSGVVYSDQFVTTGHHARPFILAEIEDNLDADRSIYPITPEDAYHIQNQRGALTDPKLMTPLERRVLLDQFPLMREWPQWQPYIERSVVVRRHASDVSRRQMTDDWEDGWMLHIGDDDERGVLIRFECSPPAGGYVLVLDEMQMERLVEHLEWVKEGRKRAAQ